VRSAHRFTIGRNVKSLPFLIDEMVRKAHPTLATQALVHQFEVENTVIVAVPDAHAAQRKQRELIDKNGGTYDKSTNSCVTHVGDVLRAGGKTDVPGTTRDTVRWLMKNGKRQ